MMLSLAALRRGSRALCRDTKKIEELQQERCVLACKLSCFVSCDYMMSSTM